jgi:hypothetical protein
MANKFWGLVLELPLILLVIGSFGASIYAAYNKISGVTYASSAVLGVVIVLYFLGVWLRSGDSDNQQVTESEY